nr:hypothetical protein BgiMline_027872 [Biomphalaria glabrata]
MAPSTPTIVEIQTCIHGSINSNDRRNTDMDSWLHQLQRSWKYRHGFMAPSSPTIVEIQTWIHGSINSNDRRNTDMDSWLHHLQRS